MSWIFIIPPRVLDLDDRQGFTARSATQKKRIFSHSLSLSLSLSLIVGHSGPLSCFSNLSLSSRKITVSHQSFTVPYPAYSFYSSFLASHFYPFTLSPYFTDIHSSQFFITDLHSFILASSLYLILFSLGALSPRSSQIFIHLSQILHLFSPSVFLTVSGPLSRSPSLPFSSLIPTVLHRSSTDLPKILLPPSLTTWYLDSRSFRPTLQFSKSLLFLPNPYRSTQIFHRSSKILLPPSLAPFFITSLSLVTLVSGQSVIPAHSPASKSLVFTDLPQILQTSYFPHPLHLGIWTVGHSGPLSRSPSLSFSFLSSQIFTDLPQIL